MITDQNTVSFDHARIATAPSPQPVEFYGKCLVGVVAQELGFRFIAGDMRAKAHESKPPANAEARETVRTAVALLRPRGQTMPGAQNREAGHDEADPPQRL